MKTIILALIAMQLTNVANAQVSTSASARAVQPKNVAAPVKPAATIADGQYRPLYDEKGMPLIAEGQILTDEYIDSKTKQLVKFGPNAAMIIYTKPSKVKDKDGNESDVLGLAETLVKLTATKLTTIAGIDRFTLTMFSGSNYQITAHFNSESEARKMYSDIIANANADVSKCAIELEDSSEIYRRALNVPKVLSRKVVYATHFYCASAINSDRKLVSIPRNDFDQMMKGANYEEVEYLSSPIKSEPKIIK